MADAELSEPFYQNIMDSIGGLMAPEIKYLTGQGLL